MFVYCIFQAIEVLLKHGTKAKETFFKDKLRNAELETLGSKCHVLFFLLLSNRRNFCQIYIFFMFRCLNEALLIAKHNKSAS